MELQSANYQQKEIFRGLVRGDIEALEKWKKLEKQEVFPIKNKLSNYLETFKVPFKFVSAQQKNEIIEVDLKLCIPFPKVEPPDIFPKFDNDLLYEFDLFDMLLIIK